LLRYTEKYKLLFSIAFLSAAIIAFQLALMQILSLVQWYHFAYMVISVALLGFGAAGTVVSIFRKALLANIEAILSPLITGMAIVMALVTDVSQMPFARFDSYLLFAEYSHIGKLIITYLLFFIPFFLGALAIGLVFVAYVDEIGKIYFVNLLGSAAGGIFALALTWLFFPKQLPALISILPLFSGIAIIKKDKLFFHAGFILIAAIVITWKLVQPPHLVLSQYKDLSKTLLLPDAKITLEKSSPFGLIQTVTSPALRYAPGLSLAAARTAKVKTAAFINGDWYGAITDEHLGDTTLIGDYTTMALPYVMTHRNHVLVLHSGMGVDVKHALNRGAKTITAIEPNSTVVSLLKNELAPVTDSLFYNSKISVHTVEPRTFLLTDTAHYDLIALPLVGTFGGSAGLYALQEQYIFTKEAFREMWLKLNPHGAVSVSCWMDYPVRNPLKILGTISEVLEELGIKNPKDHIAVVRGWATLTFVMTRSPVAKRETENIRNFCEKMMFDPALLPGLQVNERTFYNQLQDSSFFGYVDKIFSQERNEFYADYDFNIRPATDNKPYFSQFIRWKSLNHMAGTFGSHSIPFFEIGYLIVLITLIQVCIVSFVLIILPLFRIRQWGKKNKFEVVLYFGGIGLGYMFVEMVFFQRLILYFGNPVYSVSIVITSLLFFSGIGSYYSKYFLRQRKHLPIIFTIIVSLLLLYSFMLTPVLQRTVHLQLFYKLLFVAVLMAPLAFCMGIPFPAGMLHLSKMNAAQIPWAWGLNGYISVISTALATIVAVELGFTWVLLFAALAYMLPFIVQVKWNRDDI